MTSWHMYSSYLNKHFQWNLYHFEAYNTKDQNLLLRTFYSLERVKNLCGNVETNMLKKIKKKLIKPIYFMKFGDYFNYFSNDCIFSHQFHFNTGILLFCLQHWKSFVCGMFFGLRALLFRECSIRWAVSPVIITSKAPAGSIPKQLGFSIYIYIVVP